MPVKSQTSGSYLKERTNSRAVSVHDFTASSVQAKHNTVKYGISLHTDKNITLLHFTVKMRVATFYGQQLHRHYTQVMTATVT